MSDQSLFSPRLLALWIVLGALTFGLTLWFMAEGESGSTTGPSTYSKSAIGHAGMAALLRQLKIPVVQSKAESLHRAGSKNLLVLAEPGFRSPGDTQFDALLQARSVLLVLPKWLGQDGGEHPGWIGSAVQRSPSSNEWLLTEAIHDGTVLASDAQQNWTQNEFDAVPHVAGTTQLVKSAHLTPIVASAEGILLGRYTEEGRTLWVLSDPDVIANHGLGLGNADFAAALFQRLRAGGSVVFDESIHGFEPAPPDLFGLLRHRRFLPLVLESIAAMALLLWATLGRFGAAEAPPPPLEAGKQALVRNVAQLMEYAGYQHILVRRYVDATIRNAAHQLRMPRQLDGAAALDWLQRLAVARGGKIDAVALRRRAAEAAEAGQRNLPALFGIAREIRIWKQELTDGSSGRGQDRGRNPGRGAQGSGRAG
jgi:Domain of unknown function (DUF4350)